jgi:adenosylcobinamide-phosphate synthase
VRLGGTLSYRGRVEHRPVLGEGLRAVEVADIRRAVRLSRRVTWLALAACVTGRSVWGAIREVRTARARGATRLRGEARW